MEQETLEIVTQPESGVVIFEQFKEKVIQTFDGQIVEKVNPLRQRLEKLKEEYAGAEIVTDPASMKKAKEATAAFRTFKGEVESNRKLLKGLVLQLGDSVDGNHNPIYDEAESLQKKMDATAKAFEEKQKAERQAEKIALAKRKALRFDQLTQLGAFTSNGVFILGDETAMEDTVELCTDEGFDEILSRFKAEKEKNDAEAAEVERKRQEEAENLRQEQERLRVQREEMQKEQERIKEQREALEKQQQEFARQERERIEEKERKELSKKAEAEKIENERLAGRLAQLNDIAKAEIENKRRDEKEKKDRGLTRRLLLFAFDVAVGADDLAEMTQEEFDDVYQDNKQRYDEAKQQEWLENERIKKIQEEERKKEELAELTDGERWRIFKDDLAKFAGNMPDFPTGRYARMKAIALEKFGEIQSLKIASFKGNK